MTTSSLYGILGIIAFAFVVIFTAVAAVYHRRLLRQPPMPLGEEINATPRVLRKVRKREPLSPEEFDLAAAVIAARRHPMAYAIPAAVFSIGCFYVFGSLEQLHGHTPSERTFLGVIPMITSTNLAIRMRRSASLKRRLPVRPPEPQQQVDAPR
jgi:hypothetical protein